MTPIDKIELFVSCVLGLALVVVMVIAEILFNRAMKKNDEENAAIQAEIDRQLRELNGHHLRVVKPEDHR